MQADKEREVETIFPRELEMELWNHPGKWVAIVGDEVFAEGDTVLEVITSACAAGHDEPMLYKVPVPGVSYFY
jgi:hypothetical protein